jgi:hypothetical protein
MESLALIQKIKLEITTTVLRHKANFGSSPDWNNFIFYFDYRLKSEILSFKVVYPKNYPNSPFDLFYLQKLPKIVINTVIEPNGKVLFNWNQNFTLCKILDVLNFEISTWLRNFKYDIVVDEKEIPRYWQQNTDNEEIH